MTNRTDHPTEEEMVLHHYEPDPGVAGHLEMCAACRARRDGLSEFLAGIAAGGDVPERGEGYGRQVWRRLEPRLERRRPFWLADLFAPRTLALAGGVFALMAVAFIAGRSWPSKPSGTSPAARERILLVAVGEHLDRSEMVLLELLNSGGDALPKEQARAEDLVLTSRLYRQTAVRSGDRAVANVLEDLERLLLDIARSPSPLADEDRAALRRRVEKSGVLFKVRILGSRLESERAPLPGSPRV